MAASQANPSPFAVLLRRSKFASYDPTIGQVYTTHGGHAFRGDWGLKRPLGNRRRQGFITVCSVDSREQQTEWHSGESSARWMRRWEEFGKKLEVAEMSPWRSRIGPGTWKIDTEFDITRRKSKVAQTGPDSVPLDEEVSMKNNQFVEDGSNLNPEAMTPRQFKKYLERLRALRPEFKKFLREYSREFQAKQDALRPRLPSEQTQLFFTGSGDIHMFHSAQNAPERYVSEFLKRRATAELKDPTCTRIEQCPHPLAGLEYTLMSTLQSKYLHRPVPGRSIGANRPTRYEGSAMLPKFDLIAAGGIVGTTEVGSHTIVPTDFGTRETPRVNRELGKGLFRMSTVLIADPPQTVGRQPQQATNSKFLNTQFRIAQSSNLSNPYPLGSPEYVNQVNEMSTGKGHHPIPLRIRSVVRHVPVLAVTGENSQQSSTALINKLSDMISAKKGEEES